MASADEARRWLAQADADRQTLRVLASAGRHYMACFVAQQAAEKALKAFLYGAGEDPVLGHSVLSLCLRCGEYHPDFTELARQVKGLDQYYVETRYPNGLPDSAPAEFFNADDTERATAMADMVLDLVNLHLSPDNLRH